MVYIGLSQDCESRFKEHLRDLLRLDHSNYRVQEQYNLYGNPTLIVLETCAISELNNLEIVWMDEFNAIKDGLNLIEGGQVGWGTNSNASRYTRRQVLSVFSLLYRTNYTHKEISNRLNVNMCLSTDIKLGNTHCWLREVYPQQYSLMQSRIINKNIIRTKPVLISPNGEEVTLTVSLTEFCKSQPTLNHTAHSSSKGIGKVIRKERISYLGWKLKPE